MTSIDEFVAVVVHDLRNPLAVIRASAQMAQRQVGRADSEAARQRLGVIIAQADRSGALLDLFMEAARLEGPGLTLRYSSTDLAAGVRQSLEQVRRATGYTDRRVDLSLVDPCVGFWDATRIGTAVRALVENAFLYGDPERSICIEMERHGQTVRVSVIGCGSGPVPDEQPLLFQPFFRGHAAAQQGTAGSGLGLWLSRGIARAHGGDVRYAPERGADVFEIELPMAAAAN